jgi:TPR repeat protein
MPNALFGPRKKIGQVQCIAFQRVHNFSNLQCLQAKVEVQMKKIRAFYEVQKVTRDAPHDEVLDVVPKKSRADLVRICLIAVVTVAIGCVAAFYGYTEIYKPYKWRADVGRALTWIEKVEPEEKRELDELTEIRRLEKIGSTLPYRTRYATYKDRSAAAISALELADHLGSPAARFLYGELLKDGGLLEGGESTAQIQFAKGHKRLASEVQQGDARSILYYGLMLNAGFGVEANPVLSLATFESVLQELDREDLHFLLSRMLAKDVYTVPDYSGLFLRRVAEAILSKGGTINEYDLNRICEEHTYRDFCTYHVQK